MTSARPAALGGRRAFVTGGARGIGAAVVLELIAHGADVVFADIRLEDGDPSVLSSFALAIDVDVTDVEEVAKAVNFHGPFDILVNNAGRDQHAFFVDSAPADWAALLAVNFGSVLACTHAVLPGMQAAGFGRIINIASEAGRIGSKGGSVYAASKGAVIAFTKSIARESARYGVTANVVAPGPIRTPLLESAVESGGDRLLQAMKDATLLRRLGEPAEVAGLVAFLASDAAAYITAETIGVSGGMGC